MRKSRPGATVRKAIIDRRPVSLFVGAFALGVVIGLIELLTDRDKTSTGASVAVANWVHVVLALALGTALVAA